MTDRLTLTGLRARGHHGFFDYEKQQGQLFVVDVTVEIDAIESASSDDLDKTVHYGVLAEQIVHDIEHEPVDLIETLAERIAATVLSHPAARSTSVTVHKPEAPIAVPFGDVSITIERGRP
ncbi:dihydroneopterin aldolase [Frondihabitans australicus]|uniref:7,8-dihydroneopterin aldolase n=1 Tax=Frondihabitans australicus TaxID=386892 RepID=A0A495II97_9MICO|nr:dihydroneopterin aldolase [Frondihabitans australicus]RKR75704.1 dihydroneopterin aldolase [Frondihabitans australicus]